MNCHICDKPTESFKHEKTNITYYYCEACDYIFKSPECYQDLSTQKERYNLNNEDHADDIKYQLGWVLKAIKKGYKEDGKTFIK